MREQLESLLLVLAVGAVVAIGAKRFSVPYNVALVVVGLLLVFVDVLPHQAMNPEVILVAFLPLLVFEGSLFADADSLRRASRPILTLAVPGVVISLLSTAGVATFTLGLPFTVALLLGALLSITDTVSVLLAFRSVRVPHRLAAIMEGESLFNDGTALVLVSLATGVLAKGHLDAVHLARDLFVAILGGLAVGGGFAAIGSAVLRWTPDHLTAILVSIVLVLATSLIAERLHASPVIAVVVAGLAVGRTARRTLEPSRVLALQGFWETTGFGINVLLFLLVGMQIEAGMLVREAPAILIALVALHAGRAVAVYGSFGVLSAVTREPVPFKWQHVMVFGNIKGALSMAAVLALPTDLPFRQRLITIVFGVTFATLLMQALPFRRVLRALGVTLSTGDDALDRARARLIAARRAQTELDEILASGLVSRREHAERRASFQRVIIDAEGVIQRFRVEGLPDDAVDFAVLSAQKVSILDASRRGLIEGPAADKELANIDRALLALASHEGEH